MAEDLGSRQVGAPGPKVPRPASRLESIVIADKPCDADYIRADMRPQSVAKASIPNTGSRMRRCLNSIGVSPLATTDSAPAQINRVDPARPT